MTEPEPPPESGSLRGPLTGLVVFKLLINTTQRAVYPFLPAIARGLGVGLATAGAMVSVRWATGMATPLLVGTVGRKRPARTLMAIGGVIFSIGSLVTALTGVFSGAIVGFALFGIAKPTFDIGAASWISERVPFERRARSIGILETSWAGGLLVGAPLFGVLIDRFDWTAPFLVVGAATSIGLLLLLRLDASDGSQDRPNSARVPLDAEAFAFLAFGGVVSMAVELVLVVLGEWLEQGFGLTLLALGGVGTVLGASELVAEGGVLAFTDQLGTRRALQGSTLGMVVGFLGLALFADSLVAGVAALTVTILAFEFGIVSSIPLATEIRPTDRARVLSIFLVVHSLGRVIADLTAPRAFDAFGLGWLAVSAAGLSVLGWFLVTRWVRVPTGRHEK